MTRDDDDDDGGDDANDYDDDDADDVLMRSESVEQFCVHNGKSVLRVVCVLTSLNMKKIGVSMLNNCV